MNGGVIWSPNFAFLARYDAGLAVVAARAEQYFPDDPVIRIAPPVEKSRIAILAAALRGDLTRDRRPSGDMDNEGGSWPIPISWSWRRVEDVGRVGL